MRTLDQVLAQCQTLQGLATHTNFTHIFWLA